MEKHVSSSERIRARGHGGQDEQRFDICRSPSATCAAVGEGRAANLRGPTRYRKRVVEGLRGNGADDLSGRQLSSALARQTARAVRYVREMENRGVFVERKVDF